MFQSRLPVDDDICFGGMGDQQIVLYSKNITTTLGLVWKMVNTWPQKILCYPPLKNGVLIFLYPECLENNKEIKKSWFLVNSGCFCSASYANLMSDGKKKT